MNEREVSPAAATGQFFVESPAITAPRGGGSIRGIGEKFASNPVTGTGGLQVPIPITPGRFAPTLTLAYDSGGGNGPFGIGWSLGLPAITRKTDRGLPRYRDDDVFVLASAEDLVPQAGVIDREREGHLVRRYFPRVEGAFARIERWTRIGAPSDVSWRSISRDNVTTVFGGSADSRIVDPDDPARVFSWLISETYDDKGNTVSYSYQREDAVGVDRTRACEQHRGTGAGANCYLSRVRYGNRTPRTAADDVAQLAWLFEVVLDHGDPCWETAGDLFRVSPTAEAHAWQARSDAFSTYRAGFEVRTSRLCRRVLMFHRFPELGPEPLLVRSVELEYGEAASGARLARVTQRGHVVDDFIPIVERGGARYRSYRGRALPPIALAYSTAQIDDTVRVLDDASRENLPFGVDDAVFRWVDLDGEGLPGVLSEQADGWFYKRNLSARFAPLERLPFVPSPGGHSWSTSTATAGSM
ncbi:MAG: SpvB/TcaC N-terminal domain-containing protein [Kofleriaceae bacterium]